MLKPFKVPSVRDEHTMDLVMFKEIKDLTSVFLEGHEVDQYGLVIFMNLIHLMIFSSNFNGQLLFTANPNALGIMEFTFTSMTEESYKQLYYNSSEFREFIKWLKKLINLKTPKIESSSIPAIPSETFPDTDGGTRGI